MSAGFLDTLGISAEQYEQASASTVTEAFELLQSGAYPATMKSMTLYKNKFDGTMLRVEVELTDSKRTLSYRSDVGKLLKDASVNQGFLARLKSIAEACNFDANNFKPGPEVKFNSYGSEVTGTSLLGVIGKPVIALVRQSEDTDRPEADLYRLMNDIEGVTTKGSEDYNKFIEKVEKAEGKPFKYKSGYKPKGSGSNTAGANAGTAAAKAEVADVDF